MLCLACGKETGNSGAYHKKCLKDIFGFDWAPEIKFSISDLPARVSRTAGRMSISGVQIKASIRPDETTRTLEIVAEGGTHILKPEPNEYPELPQNENFCMCLAAELKMRVPPHGLFQMSDGKLCYLIKRFDRTPAGKIHKEDLAQILNLSPTDKYSASLEAVGRAVRDNTANPFLELYEFFLRVVFNFAIGNGDMHLKNWSLLTPRTGGNSLAPCYDLVSSKIYLPDEEESALSLNAKRNKLARSDFEKFAAYLGIEPKAAVNAIDQVVGLEAALPGQLERSFLSAERQNKISDIVTQRISRLKSH